MAQVALLQLSCGNWCFQCGIGVCGMLCFIWGAPLYVLCRVLHSMFYAGYSTLCVIAPPSLGFFFIFAWSHPGCFTFCRILLAMGRCCLCAVCCCPRGGPGCRTAVPRTAAGRILIYLRHGVTSVLAKYKMNKV